LNAALMLDFDAWADEALARIETLLDAWVPLEAPAGLGEAMRYAVLGGGKRLRPLLVLAACEAVAGDGAAADRAAVSVELIHAYSLVHDDMPCMDNDVLRRGKPTVHVAFGEAQAMLAGDAMQALAFDVLTPDTGMDPALQAALCRLLARASGHAGMAGGQAIDLAAIGQPLSEAQLRDMHHRKTGLLLRASVQMGAACGAHDAAAELALCSYGAAIGLAFQVIDDILDVTQDSATLGKTAGKDEEAGKPTYVSVMGLEASRRYASRLRDEAIAALDSAPHLHSLRLRELAYRVVARDN
jgi:farnesyl diphosphate synthase